MFADTKIPIKYPKYLRLSIDQQHVAACQSLWPIGRHCLAYQTLFDPGSPDLPIISPLSGTISKYISLDDKSLVQIEIDTEQVINSHILANRAPDYWHEWPEWLRQSGLKGMGGSGYPTWKKIQAMPFSPHAIVINAVECEPGLHVDRHLFVDQLDQLQRACAVLATYFSDASVHMVVSESIISSLKCDADWPCQVTVIKANYPAGQERQILQQLNLMAADEWRYPAELGIWVMNIHSLWSLFQWWHHGMPACWRILGITEQDQTSYQWLPIGTPAEEMVSAPSRNTSRQVALGGNKLHQSFPLGMLHLDLNHLHWNFVVAEPEDHPVSRCFRCGACYPVCPVNLNVPHLLACSEREYWAEAKAERLHQCLKCGACEAVCPAQLPLTKMLSQYQAELWQWQTEQQWFDSCQARAAAKQAVKPVEVHLEDTDIHMLFQSMRLTNRSKQEK